MQIETWALDKIKPYAKNPRKISQKAIDKVALSLQRFGWQQPIVVDKKGVIVAGHTRWLAAKQLKWTEAPVHIAHKLTPELAQAYRLMDNRSLRRATGITTC
jgi:ParB family chromosome partitioning protein